jgi:hypothetical protein
MNLSRRAHEQALRKTAVGDTITFYSYCFLVTCIKKKQKKNKKKTTMTADFYGRFTVFVKAKSLKFVVVWRYSLQARSVKHSR